MGLGSRERIIRKCCVWTHEHVIAELQPVPQLDSTFDGDTVTYHDIIFDEHVITDIAILAELRSGQDMRKRPDAGPSSNRPRVADPQRVYEDMRIIHEVAL
jgi:hypothetical protein